MPSEFSFRFPLPHGLHARPAIALQEVAKPFASEITLINDRTGARASLKSVLALVSTITLPGDPCRIVFEGADESRARETVARFVAEKLPHCDDPPPEPPPIAGEVRLPRCLRDTGAVLQPAKSAVPGIGVGRLVRMPVAVDPAIDPTPAAFDPAKEKERLLNALSALDRTYEHRIKTANDKVASGLLQAHRIMARDQTLKSWLVSEIEEQHRTATQAVVSARDHFAAVFSASASAMLRERALDVRDVCRQLLLHLNGVAVGPSLLLTENSVLVAESLTPSDLLALDRRFLKGLALAKTGATSHSVILARSFGIPCVIDIGDFSAARWEGQEAVVDGELGLLATSLTATARRYYEMEQRRLQLRRDRVQHLAALPGQTADGARLEIAANISSADEAALAVAGGSEGIGLFRTEMFFMDRSEPPGEEEQCQIYSRVLRDAGGQTVIIRTLDIGGDKPQAWLNLPSEENPMLGARGARLYQRLESLFRVQVRALLRASANSSLRVMFPMITQVAEVRWIKRIFNEERARLAADGIPLGHVPLGAMIEVPAAAFELTALCHELDFFSIGSNDLVHYFTATDRGNPATLDDPLAPAFLRLLRKIVDDTHAASRWIGLCGEMGANPEYLPLFVGLGLDEISVPMESLAAIKQRLASLLAADCRRLLADALDCHTADDVRGLLQQREAIRPLSLLATDLVILDSPATTKAEAIKTLCDALYASGRTETPRRIEDAIWQREAVYSTGIGRGFAIPHCKTTAISANSLCVLRPVHPIPWRSGGESVNLVVLLAIRESDQAAEYLKIISRLGRLLVDEAFRGELAAATSPVSVIELLGARLKVSAPR